MASHAYIIVFGTGSFAGRTICDIAGTAATPVRIVIAGRNVERMNWLKVAADARATVFTRPAQPRPLTRSRHQVAQIARGERPLLA